MKEINTGAITKLLEAFICPDVRVLPRAAQLMAVSAEWLMPEVAVHLRPTWSEECEEIMGLFILHLLKCVRKVLMARRKRVGRRG